MCPLISGSFFSPFVIDFYAGHDWIFPPRRPDLGDFQFTSFNYILQFHKIFQIQKLYIYQKLKLDVFNKLPSTSSSSLLAPFLICQ